MLEQVRGLGIVLERVLLVEQARVKPFIAHRVIALQAATHAPASHPGNQPESPCGLLATKRQTRGTGAQGWLHSCVVNCPR